MSSRIRAHIRTNVVGYVAIFLFSIGGTAWATHPGGANTISTTDIINGEVKQADVGVAAINTPRLADDAVSSPKIFDSTIKTTDINNNNGVRSPDVRNDTLAGGGLAAVDLAANSVGFSEIASGAFFPGDIAENVFFGDYEIPDNAVQSNEISDGGVGANDLAAISTRVNSVVVPSGGTESVRAFCQADELLISGGADWPGTSDKAIFISKSRNDTGGLGGAWFVRGTQSTGADQTLAAEAYCLDLGATGFAPQGERK